MKRRRILRGVALLCLLVGAVLLLRPVVNRVLHRWETERLIETFTQNTLEMTGEAEGAGSVWDDDEWEALYWRIVAYNRALYADGQSDLVDALSYEQVDFSLVEFGFDEEMIGYITIPTLDVELPIYLGANTQNLNRGAAHLTQTSLPVGGENTNAVIAAHRGYNGIPMFRNIHLLEEGDLVYITNFRETLTYQVAETKVISPNAVDQILIQEGRDLVTLISCNPLGKNYERYVVYCERVG